MTIMLTAESEAKVRERVARGTYASADAVLDEALRLLEEHEKLVWLRAAIAEGMEGEAVELTEEMRAESWERAMRRARAGEKPSADVMLDDEPF